MSLEKKRNYFRSILYFYRYFGIPLIAVKSKEGTSRYIYRFMLADIRVPVEKLKKLTSNLSLFLGLEPSSLGVKITGGFIEISVPKEEETYPTFEEVHEKLNKLNPKALENPLIVPIGYSEVSSVLCLNLGSPYSCHIALMGQTRAGKTVALYGILASVALRATPDEVKFVFIDIKNRLSVFDGLEHLVMPASRTIESAEEALNWVVNEMRNRYRSGINLRTVPSIILCIDELAGLLRQKPKLADMIEELVSMGAEAKIIVIVASQKYTSDNLGGRTNIANNFPCKIGFKVDSSRESTNFMGKEVALQNLRGKGDCIIKIASSFTQCQFMYTSEDFIRDKIVSQLSGNQEGLIPTFPIHQEKVEILPSSQMHYETSLKETDLINDTKLKREEVKDGEFEEEHINQSIITTKESNVSDENLSEKNLPANIPEKLLKYLQTETSVNEKKVSSFLSITEEESEGILNQLQSLEIVKKPTGKNKNRRINHKKLNLLVN